MTKIFPLIFFSTIVCCYGQFQPNSTGVVYFDGETPDAYEVKIVLPVEALSKSNSNAFWENQTNNSLDFSGEILFFDQNGDY
jgi:hypothetical protein